MTDNIHGVPLENSGVVRKGEHFIPKTDSVSYFEIYELDQPVYCNDEASGVLEKVTHVVSPSLNLPVNLQGLYPQALTYCESREEAEMYIEQEKERLTLKKAAEQRRKVQTAEILYRMKKSNVERVY